MATDKAKEKKAKKSPREAWLAIAPKRISRALKATAAVTKLARPKSYSWTPTELEKMIAALGAEFERLERSFRNPGTQAAEGFKF